MNYKNKGASIVAAGGINRVLMDMRNHVFNPFILIFGFGAAIDAEEMTTFPMYLLVRQAIHQILSSRSDSH